jgi:hypothetical protein
MDAEPRQQPSEQKRSSTRHKKKHSKTSSSASAASASTKELSSRAAAREGERLIFSVPQAIVKDARATVEDDEAKHAPAALY